MKETLLQRCQREAREKWIKELLAREDGKKPHLGGASLWNAKLLALSDTFIANTLKQAAEALEGMKKKNSAYEQRYKEQAMWADIGYDQALTDAQKLLTGEDNE